MLELDHNNQERGGTMSSPKYPVKAHILSHSIKNVLYKFVRNGQIFGLQFYNEDGSLRKMCARSGVLTGILRNEGEKELTAYGWLADVTSKNITVFDMAKRGYLSVRLDSIHRITVKGMLFEVVQNNL